ncbi:putative peroxidase [Helianthus annuus]|nr:putative peroxidase [Helianthus annuus]
MINLNHTIQETYPFTKSCLVSFVIVHYSRKSLYYSYSIVIKLLLFKLFTLVRDQDPSSGQQNLPAFNDPVGVQIRKFTDKGLNTQDLVALSGAHTIGTAACALFSYRLYNYNNTNGPDPTIDPAFLPTLRNLCPNGGDGSRRVDLDPASVGRFDNSYYANLRNRRGVLESDAALWNDPTTQRFVNRFLGVRGLLGLTFNVEFGRSMIKMGNIQVKTGTQGEIRRVCSATN